MQNFTTTSASGRTTVAWRVIVLLCIFVASSRAIARFGITATGLGIGVGVTSGAGAGVTGVGATGVGAGADAEAMVKWTV